MTSTAKALVAGILGNIEDWPVEELKLRSFYDREKPTRDVTVPAQNGKTDQPE